MDTGFFYYRLLHLVGTNSFSRRPMPDYLVVSLHRFSFDGIIGTILGVATCHGNGTSDRLGH